MNVPLTRRAFLRRAAAGAIAAGVGSGAVGSLPSGAARAANALEEMPEPIVDTHQHLWDLKRFRLPWITADSPLAKSFLPRDYAQAAAGLNIVRAVYMEVDVDPEQQLDEVAYVSQLCQAKNGLTAAAVISGRPADEGFGAYLGRIKANPHVRGMRQVLHGPTTPAGYCLDKRFIAGVRQVGELGWSFDLCLRAAELPDAVRLVDACPDTRFVLDHCGNASLRSKDLTEWRRDMEAVARRGNTIGKISGVVASAPRGEWSVEKLAPIVNHTLDVFGPDRVVFGGDWPVCTTSATLAEWVGALRAIVAGRTAAQRRKLFHDNAVAFYRLA